MNYKHLLTATLVLGLFLNSSSAYAESENEKTPMSSSISKILLSEKEDAKVTWTITGDNQMGVKVIWSKEETPVYPTKDGATALYVSDKDQNTAFLKSFDGAGDYHVRVCEYLDGVCGTYSNEITINLPEMLRTLEKREFSDLDEKNEHYEAVTYLKDKEVVKGYDDDSFKPNQVINRAEFLKIVMGVSGHSPAGKNCFKDVNEEWHAEYICKAKALKQISGYEDGSFRPEQPIVYAEAAKIIVNLLALESKDTDNENWYHRYVGAMELLAAIPTSIDSFHKPITRGEMAEMIFRIDAKKRNKSSLSYKTLKESQGGELIIKLDSAGDNKVIWKSEGYSAKGFKVVWSKTSGPAYPNRKSDQYQYHEDSKSNYAHLKAFDGPGKYFVRVCEYLGDECGIYSNEITIELSTEEKPTLNKGEVKSIKLFEKAEGKVAWEVDGYSAKGFKVVWSKSSGPVYPSRENESAQYEGDPDRHYAFLKGFDGAGKYFVRVCEYLEGSCGVYSNEISMELAEKVK